MTDHFMRDNHPINPPVRVTRQFQTSRSGVLGASTSVVEKDSACKVASAGIGAECRPHRSSENYDEGPDGG